jgi:FKBP-type peptidyl-prolyl cis-trans isomerase FklB
MTLRVLFLLLIAASTARLRAADPSSLNNEKDRRSYGIGAYTGSFWKSQGMETNDLDWNRVIQGFKAGFYGERLLLTEPEIHDSIRLIRSDARAQLQARREQERQRIALEKKKESDAFLARNKTSPGVRTLPNGLQYSVLKEGSGPHPTTNDSVVVNYRGTLIDGKQFDTSGQSPIPLPVAGAKGWVQALQLMNAGAQWHVLIPPELAYGERGSGTAIGPNAVLVYDIELVSVQSGGTMSGPVPAPPR